MGYMHFGELGWGSGNLVFPTMVGFLNLWLLGALTFCLCLGCLSTYISMIINGEHNLHLEKKFGNKMNNGKKSHWMWGLKLFE
jgi:hypothetical protein